MSVSQATIELACDIFSGVGEVSARKMFGGAGLYAQGVMFALIDDERIYLKTDEPMRTDLAAVGAESWIYTEVKGPRAGLSQATSYWSLPDSAIDDPEEAAIWGKRAVQVALAIKAARPSGRRNT